jgi:DNA-binding response OmpR family regulator
MSSPATILLVEGVRPVSSLAPLLDAKGYHVVRSNNAKEALNSARAQAPALAVVDCTTLHTDGLKICVDLRASTDAMPIVVVVRKGVDPDKITCADSVLARPFTPRKLINRITRLLPDSAGEVLKVGDLALNIESHYLRVGKTEQHLTPMKARLLEAFMRNPGETLSREFLMKNVWKTDYIGDTRTIEVHVRWLRQIIEADPCSPKLLQTVRGVGYRLTIGVSH